MNPTDAHRVTWIVVALLLIALPEWFDACAFLIASYVLFVEARHWWAGRKALRQLRAAIETSNQ